MDIFNLYKYNCIMMNFSEFDEEPAAGGEEAPMSPTPNADAPSAENVKDAQGRAVYELLNADRKTIADIQVFLESSGEKNLQDITKFLEDIGRMQEDFFMNGKDAPQHLDEAFVRLDELYRRHHIADIEEELRKDAPDLLQILRSVRMASDNAASMPAAVKEDLERLKAEIASNNLQHETYDKMCDLSAVVAEAIPHLADSKNILTARSVASALISGATEYITVAMDLVSRLRTDPGKNGAESQVALHEMARRITEITGQLREEK